MGNIVTIFTDGACSGNPGPGGWAAIVLLPNSEVQELGGGAANTSNNRMELIAVIEALRYSYGKTSPETPINIYTDSTYIIRGITGWIFNWRKNNWLTSLGEPVGNQDLWEMLFTLTHESHRQLKWHYVRGHSGTPGNERCDEIAVSFSKHTPISLYSGSIDAYQYDLNKLPDDTSLPPMKSLNGEKSTAPVTYLSYVHGKLHRDKDWKSCEARVKGVPGAKFKKISSAQEEAEILKKWGV